VLTGELAEWAGWVVAVEKDDNLSHLFRGDPGISKKCYRYQPGHPQGGTRGNISGHFPDRQPPQYKVVANLLTI